MKFIAVSVFLVGMYFFVDQAQLAWTVYGQGGLSLLLYHFLLGTFLTSQILAVVLPIAGVLLWKRISKNSQKGDRSG